MFNFGKKKPDKKQIIIISIVLSTIIAGLSQCTGVSENGLWDLLDEIQRKYFPQTVLNEIFIQDPDKVNRRVERDVNDAIDNYWNQTEQKRVEVHKPIYIEEDNDESVCYSKECKKLAPPMRICAPWVENCF